MDSLLAVDWGELFAINVSPLEIFVRGSAIYWFLFVVFRFVIRRDIGSVGIADVLILVMVADAAQNGMAGDYDSITEGILLISTLLGWNLLLDWLSFRFKSVRRFAEAGPSLLVKDGRILRRAMRRELMTDEELWGKLREHGIESLQDVKRAYMENDGQISVIKRQ